MKDTALELLDKLSDTTSTETNSNFDKLLECCCNGTFQELDPRNTEDLSRVKEVLKLSEDDLFTQLKENNYPDWLFAVGAVKLAIRKTAHLPCNSPESIQAMQERNAKIFSQPWSKFIIASVDN